VQHTTASASAKQTRRLIAEYRKLALPDGPADATRSTSATRRSRRIGESMTYTPAQVTRALMRELVAHGGSVREGGGGARSTTSSWCRSSTLRHWRDEDHAEQYRRLAEEYGREARAGGGRADAQRNMRKAAQLEEELIEAMAHVPAEQKPQALRALADSKAKNVDKILALTGRPSSGEKPLDLQGLLRGMEGRGYLKINIGIEQGQEPPKRADVDSTAEEEPDAG
jgi:hypothetical protein